ncbi:hypothetical protein FIBSPDRAFT_969578 [Athelia psychrophila]|uniref:Uncharacterized protein n=1 Tax=Athelia psychrophila TaxID=1759441 RepID=A0A167TDB7_9AGAM|nr:hypothetical protein FIBSPDRAFT_969578 [Fibularhizoctonia sp. CBS 109695]
MADHMSSREIAKATHITKRTVQRVVALWKQTGKVERKNKVRGQLRVLNSGDVASPGLIEKNAQRRGVY